MAATNINIRTDSETKTQVSAIFANLGLDMSTAINIFLRRVIADKGIPFQLKLSRAEQIGEEAAGMELAFRQAVKSAIANTQEKGLPVARFDANTKRPYLEYPDGRKEYTL
ncbi:hypothetical protein FACS1894200_04880 [Spirochaetia bacterium]|nr:hypothetical protein FACS1894200_04880 [Spirochaetia bacterium]